MPSKVSNLSSSSHESESEVSMDSSSSSEEVKAAAVEASAAPAVVALGSPKASAEKSSKEAGTDVEASVAEMSEDENKKSSSWMPSMPSIKLSMPLFAAVTVGASLFALNALGIISLANPVVALTSAAIGLVSFSINKYVNRAKPEQKDEQEKSEGTDAELAEQAKNAAEAVKKASKDASNDATASAGLGKAGGVPALKVVPASRETSAEPEETQPRRSKRLSGVKA